MIDFTIEDNCYANDTFIGTTVAKKITVNILNQDNEIDLENKEIQPFVGVNDEYIPFGNFIIEKPTNEEVKEKTSFVGYDYMIKFNVPYENRVIYPIQVNLFLQDLCSQVGLRLGNVDFPNADFIVTENPFINNEDCRTVLSNIAQLAGGFAKIGRDNKVYIVTLKNATKLTVEEIDEMTVETLNNTLIQSFVGQASTPQESLDGNNYFTDFSKNNKWGELNSLTLAVSDIDGENTSLEDEDSIEENGPTNITITDNYFLLNEAKRRSAIISLWNELNGIEYLPFKTDYYGYPYLDSGDMIYIQDSKDVIYTSFVFNHTFTFNGSFKGSIDTPALTKAQTAYKNITDIKTTIKRAERNIDKINGTIEDIIEQTDENTQRISRHTQTINEITDEVSEKIGEEEIIAKLNLAIQDGQGTINITGNQVTIDSDNFELSADGKVSCTGMTINNGLLSLEDDGREGDIVAIKIHSTLGDDDDPDAPDETESIMELYSNGMSFSEEDANESGSLGYIGMSVDPGVSGINLVGSDGEIEMYADAGGGVLKVITPVSSTSTSMTKITGTNIQIPKNGTAGYGLTNTSGSSIIRDHNNTNVTVCATGGTLYLGYQNTTSLNFMNGKATMDSSGNFATQGNVTINNGYRVVQVQHGNVSITPSAANTPTGKAITFSKAFSGVPTVVTTARSGVPGTSVTGTGASGFSASGCTIYVTRTNTSATGVNWIATY